MGTIRETKMEIYYYQLGPRPNDLPGKWLHIPHPETGLQTSITIGKLIDDYGEALKQDPNRQVHFEIKFNRDEKKDIMSYNDIIEYMNRDSNMYDGEYWQYLEIIGHHKVSTDHPTYKGSSTNLRILWENGDETDEPLQKFGDDAPIDCAIYAKKHGLLNKPGWR